MNTECRCFVARCRALARRGGGGEGGEGGGMQQCVKFIVRFVFLPFYQSNLGKILMSAEKNRSMRYVSGSMTYDQQRRLNITENQSRSQ